MNLLVLIIPLLAFTIPTAFADSSNIGTVNWKQEIISSNRVSPLQFVFDSKLHQRCANRESKEKR